MITILRDAFGRWGEVQASRMAAATAYYALFSLAPFIGIVLMIAGTVLQDAAVENQLYVQMNAVAGQNAANAVRSIVQNVSEQSMDGFSAVISGAVLLLAATGLMKGMRSALNTIWNIQQNPKKSSIVFLLWKNLLSMIMVLSIGFLFLLSVLISTVLSVAMVFITDVAPIVTQLAPILNIGTSFVVVTLLCALLYKYLPDASIPWRAVWPGALLTGALFTVGQFALGYYAGQRDFTAVYGVAGSVILLLLWVQYTAQILYYGAAVVRQYALAHNIPITPNAYTVIAPEQGHVVLRQSRFRFVKKAKVITAFLLFEGKYAWKLYRFLRRRKKKR